MCLGENRIVDLRGRRMSKPTLHPPPIMPLPGPRAQSKPEVQAVSAAAPGPRKNRAEACGSMGGPWCHESRLRGGGQVHV